MRVPTMNHDRIGHKLKGDNFGRQPSWIKIYSSSDFKIKSTQSIICKSRFRHRLKAILVFR